MKNVSNKCQNKKEKWKKYIIDNHTMPNTDMDICNEILDSWKRCKYTYNLTNVPKHYMLSPEQLERVLVRNNKFISIAHNYMQNLYLYIKGTNFVLTLTDSNGVVLDIVSDESDALINNRIEGSQLKVGVSRKEEHAGTCGIGLALKLQKPVQVFASEHYFKYLHGFIGTAAPIYDPKGNVIGCLDVLGPVGFPHNHTLAMVCAAADSIQKELIMAEAYHELSVLNHQLKATFNTIDSGIITFNNMGIITQYNPRACQILHLTSSRLEKENIANIFDLSKSTFNPFEELADVHDRDVVMHTYKGERLNLSLSLSIIRNSMGQKTGSMLTLNESKKIHKLISKMGGFTATYTMNSILGTSPEMQAVKKMASTAASNNSNVLILGESGTGKELIAQAIHNSSTRKNKPFVAINCASLPEGLIESELFGYASGAFTGAKKDGQPGKFELANGGTIFLDEIGDMPLKLQTSLLRVLQTREVVRIGGSQVHKVDVRIIAATNRDLLNEIKEKNFREDLYYRINVLPIEVPPLRERRSDICMLVEHFIAKNNRALDKKVSHVDETAKQVLLNYDWPGNVREMENVIERAINLSSGSEITVEELPKGIIEQGNDDSDYIRYLELNSETQKDTYSKSKQILMDALAAEHGNVSKAAEKLGIPRRTFYRRIEKFDINVDEFRLL